MNEENRQPLSGSILLSRSPDGSAPETYIVRSVSGKGGSSICYRADHILPDGTVKTGMLKEFYPCELAENGDYCEMKRMPNGQLLPGCGTVRRFDSMCKDYLDAYRLLWQKEREPENEILKRYIQEGEILYGCPTVRASGRKSIPNRIAQLLSGAPEAKPERPTVYIWSSGFSGETFEEYLEKLRSEPERRPEEKLRAILSVMEDLTDCIKAMHEAGLLHLDIKPSNFMLMYNSDGRVDDPDNILISLYDINTMRSGEDSDSRRSVIGSEGYHAPEKVKNDLSDIYSLGATLFRAVVVSDAIPDSLYRDRYFREIPRIIQNSELFRESLINSDGILMNHICRILTRCLAVRPYDRYEGLGEMKNDLKETIGYLDSLLNRRVEHQKADRADPRLAMQKLLYEHPLYEGLGTDEDPAELNVLLLGVGSYGQTFMDACLQAGQMAGTRLHILAVSDNREESREAYLKFRPALPEFVDVDGSLEGREDTALATLDFLQPGDLLLEKDPKLRLSSINGSMAAEMADAARHSGLVYHYVFVGMEQDALSRRIAQSVAKAFGKGCTVAYTCSGEAEEETDSALCPVWVDRPLQTDSIDKNLAEMAFNTHMAWKSAMDTDVTEEREKFFAQKTAKDRYNFSSSVSFVLSIRYKMRSIHLDDSSPEETAKLFSERILKRRKTDPAAQETFDQLAMMEHRRWLMDRVVCGWSAPRDKAGKLDLQSCVERGAVRDEVHCTHPCIVRSSAAAPLRSAEYRQNRKKWDEGEIDPSLDELDQMSIRLHRCFRRRADEFRSSNSCQNELALIRDQIPPENKQALQALGQYGFAVKNILRGSENYSRQYGHYHERLETAAKQMGGVRGARICEQLELLKKMLFPVVESNLYRDYKANDDTLLEKIPFILTYRYAHSMAAVFEDGRRQSGRNDEAFTNVAAATVLSPAKLCYFYCFDEDSSAELLDKKLRAVLNYFNNRKAHCSIRMVVCCLETVPDERCAELDAKKRALMAELKDAPMAIAQMEDLTVCSAATPADAEKVFLDILAGSPVELFDLGNDLFSGRRKLDNLDFTQKMEQSGVPCFLFDWRNREFSWTKGCDQLKYVRNDAYIRVNDMFALMNASDCSFNLPEFEADYETLWKICTGNANNFENSIKNWNRLCGDLGRHEEKNGACVSIDVKELRANPDVTAEYFLPEYAFRSTKKLLRELKEAKLILSGEVVCYTSDTCKLTLTAKERYLEDLDKIFGDPRRLLPYYDPHLEKGVSGGKYRCYRFCWNELQIRNAPVQYPEECAMPILQALQDAHFIRNLQAEDGCVSFVCSSPRIRQLLTSAGQILEIYTYYSVLKNGGFDDVATGYTFSWGDDEVRNELDLVLTKGFRSMIVECKAVAQLEADYYYKLESLGRRFGIGTTLVLLGNTYSSASVRKEANRMQISRGSQMGIVTVSDLEDIRNIGKVLAELME